MPNCRKIIFALNLAFICLIIHLFNPPKIILHLIPGAGDIKMSKTQSLLLKNEKNSNGEINKMNTWHITLCFSVILLIFTEYLETQLLGTYDIVKEARVGKMSEKISQDRWFLSLIIKMQCKGWIVGVVC